jgi:hypothetical protein
MNNLLYEIKKQAGIDNRFNTTEEFHKFLDTYAELIIRKCADTSFEHWLRCNNSFYDCSAESAILKQFNLDFTK